MLRERPGRADRGVVILCLLLRQDWGQYNAGYRGDPDSRTPAVDSLAAEGLVLERLCVVAAGRCC